MKTVPLLDNSGTIPLRTSANPVLGVFRHHCGEIATIHQPRGKKSHLRYILCDKCGCDQASGKSYQEKIRENSFNSIEELEDFERLGIVPSEYEAARESASIEAVTEEVTEKVTVKSLPEVTLQTAPVKVVTVNEQANESEIKTETQQPEKVTESVTEKATVKQTGETPPETTPNLKKIGIAAIVGGLLGGFLALAR